MSTSSLASTRRGVLIISLALVGACNGEAPSATTQRAPFIQGASDLVFLAQNANPGAVMEALFVGRVASDRAGCLRLVADGQDASTVIWPVGFSVRLQDADVLIVDSNDRVVGEVGGSFRLGGGHVPELHEGIPVSPADRARATSRCPGRYWIVGDVP